MGNDNNAENFPAASMQSVSPGKKVPEISIVVPVYNVARYLPECLDSILNQSYEDWECVIVDDGSTDLSPEICDRYEEKDSRFRVVHQKNGGLSHARNVGLEYSSGKYVAFVDSDDWLDNDYLATLHSLIKKYDADMAVCGFVKEFSGFKRKKAISYGKEVEGGEELYKELLLGKRLPGYMWNKLIRRNVISKLFPVGKNYEDFYVLSFWAKNIKRIAITPECLYHYRMRKGSITSRSDSKFQMDFIEAIRVRAEELKKNLPELFNIEEEQRYYYTHYLERAKVIARRENVKSARDSAISQIRTELMEIPVPDTRVIGKKLWKRAILLKENPAKFSKKMRLAGFLDLHDRFCATRLYR